MYSENVKTFLKTGVVTTAPVSQYRWRTLPALARGTGVPVEKVLEALKEDPASFEIRLGQRGDVYVALAD